MINELEYLSTGLCPNCNDCAYIFGYDDVEKFNQDYEVGDLYDEGSFSWHPCDHCNTSLGGNSYLAHGRDSNDDLVHFQVCVDCCLEINI